MNCHSGKPPRYFWAFCVFCEVEYSLNEWKIQEFVGFDSLLFREGQSTSGSVRLGLELPLEKRAMKPTDWRRRLIAMLGIRNLWSPIVNIELNKFNMKLDPAIMPSRRSKSPSRHRYR